MRAPHWSIGLYASSHACPPDHAGMAPQQSSMWLRVEDRDGARWIDVTQDMHDVSVLCERVRETVANIVDIGALVVPVRDERGERWATKTTGS